MSLETARPVQNIFPLSTGCQSQRTRMNMALFSPPCNCNSEASHKTQAKRRGGEKKRRGREVIRPIKMARPKHLGTTTMQRCDNHKNQERNVGEKKNDVTAKSGNSSSVHCLWQGAFVLGHPCGFPSLQHRTERDQRNVELPEPPRGEGSLGGCDSHCAWGPWPAVRQGSGGPQNRSSAVALGAGEPGVDGSASAAQLYSGTFYPL